MIKFDANHPNVLKTGKPGIGEEIVSRKKSTCDSDSVFAIDGSAFEPIPWPEAKKASYQAEHGENQARGRGSPERS